MVSDTSQPDPSQWLTTPAALDQWLEDHQGQPIGIDTEFERISTYYPIPALVQLAYPGEFYLVEPQVVEQSKRFRELLADSGQPKLLYAMSEDVELFRSWLGVPPSGMIDLQLGAALGGFGFSVGYARIVETVLGTTLDKDETRSDWLARPLSTAQENYALNDVRYLHPLWQHISAALQERQLSEALIEESERFCNELNASVPDEEMYLKMRGGWRLNPIQQGVLKKLAAWREKQSRERNRPRGRIVSDTGLIGLAERLPDSLPSLSRVADVPPPVVRRYGEILLELIREGQTSPLSSDQMITQPLSVAEQDRFKKAKKLFRVKAEAQDIPIELVAPRRKLEQLIHEIRDHNRTGDSVLLKGWRERLLAENRIELEKLLSQ